MLNMVRSVRSGEHQCINPIRPGSVQGRRGGSDRSPAGHDVIHQDDMTRPDLTQSLWRDGERVPKVCITFPDGQANLARGVPDSNQDVGTALLTRKALCQFVRLVVSALLQAPVGQRDTHHTISFVQ